MVSKLSKHTLAVFKNNNLKVNNAKLQKVMFFAFLDALKENKEIDYEDSFVAWKYGASIPNDYHHYKKYGGLSILEDGEYFEDLSYLDNCILKYAEKSTHSLAMDSMKSTLWVKNKDNILSGHYYPKYSLENLKEDALKLV